MNEEHRHAGDPVRVGTYEVLAGGSLYLAYDKPFPRADIFVLLTTRLYRIDQDCRAQGMQLIHFGVRDYGVPKKEPWLALVERLARELQNGKIVSIYCGGGHGRTGMLLGSLVALLEPGVDPVQAVRERYCPGAIETEEQEAFVRSTRE